MKIDFTDIELKTIKKAMDFLLTTPKGSVDNIMASSIIKKIGKQSKSDLVAITCYGQTEVLERREAIEIYKDCIYHSEGSERDRYINIVRGLECGWTKVSDLA